METLREELKRQVYVFILGIYELSGSVSNPGVLVRDIEALGNRILTLTAKYPIAADKSGLLKEILGELKSLKALLGVARDTRLVDRERINAAWEGCVSLESEFEKILGDREQVIGNREKRLDKEAENKEQGSNDIVEESRLQKKRLSPSAYSLTPKGVKTSAGKSAGKPHFAEATRGKQDVALRQTAILEVLKRRDQITIGELGVLFSGRVTKKTLQRDLQALIERQVVKRIGDKRWAAYSLKDIP